MSSRSTQRATRRWRSWTASPNPPRSPLVRPATAAVAIAVVALLASGCGAVGRVTTGDPSRGKELFTAVTPRGSCATCHTLADAGATGTIGPNLDDAFASDKQQGFSEQTIKDIVRGQIAYPEPPMPANLYRGQDAKDVATYVAKCAGNPSCGVTAAKPAPTAAPTTSTTTTTTTTTGSAGAANGKAVFLSAGCGSCHTLKAAGTSGNVGPNLDALKPPEAKIVKQVTNGGAIMPPFKNKLTPAQIQAVAAYVASVAGK